MKKRKILSCIVTLLLASMIVVTATAQDVLDRFLLSIWDTTENTVKVSFSQSSITGNVEVGGTLDVTGNTTIGGTLGVTGNSTLSGTLAVTGDVDLTGNLEVNGFLDSPYLAVAAASYTVGTDSKAAFYVVNYTDTGTVSFILDTDVVVDGRIIVVKDGQLNAGTNNITISTEGAETIDESETYVMDTNGESVTLLSDGTNWFVIE